MILLRIVVLMASHTRQDNIVYLIRFGNSGCASVMKTIDGKVSRIYEIENNLCNCTSGIIRGTCIHLDMFTGEISGGIRIPPGDAEIIANEMLNLLVGDFEDAWLDGDVKHRRDPCNAIHMIAVRKNEEEGRRVAWFQKIPVIIDYVKENKQKVT